MKIYFNTKAFDVLDEKHQLTSTDNLAEAEVAVLGAKTIDFGQAKKLKAVYRFGVGRDNIPEEIIKEERIRVVFPSEETKNILYEATADFTVFMIFSAYYGRALGQVDGWKKVTREMLSGKSLLVIGMGNIGKRVFDKMKHHMKVCSYDVTTDSESKLYESLRTADIISVHIPLNKTTTSFLNREKLDITKENAIFINSSRGAVFDEDALFQKLETSQSTAFFDVFWQEPYSGKLKDLGKKKFFMSPHTSSQTIEFVQAGFNDILALLDSCN